MRILVTGNLGYVGPVLGKFARENITITELIGVDLLFSRRFDYTRKIRRFIL